MKLKLKKLTLPNGKEIESLKNETQGKTNYVSLSQICFTDY